MHALTAVSRNDRGVLHSPTTWLSFHPGRGTRETRAQPGVEDQPASKPPTLLPSSVVSSSWLSGKQERSKTAAYVREAPNILCIRVLGIYLWLILKYFSRLRRVLAPFFLPQTRSLLSMSGPRLCVCDMELKLWIAPIKRELLQVDEGSTGDCRATGMLFGDANGILSQGAIPPE